MPVKVMEQVLGNWQGQTITQYTIAAAGGIQVSVMNYGATITALRVPDSKGVSANIVLGFDTLEGYLQAPGLYMGSICGRYANRIRNAQFELAGRQYRLTANDHGNCLHGGSGGFDKVYWEAEVTAGDTGVRFSYTSADGEAGFPGNLAVTVEYTVAGNDLAIAYRATTDKATPVNLTSHAYFNLSGGADADIFNHQLRLYAAQYLEVCSCKLPTGKLLDVQGTDMDFGQLRKPGRKDYDHCWVLSGAAAGTLQPAATLVHSASGRSMEVLTTEPGIQCYTGSLLGGQAHHPNQGLCLEAQHFPDSLHHPHFPGTVLQPGDEYRQQTIYRFCSSHTNK